MRNTTHLSIKCSNKSIETAFNIAKNDLLNNIKPFKDGMLKTESPCLMAGAEYITPWTRDAAINTVNGLHFLAPDTAKNTLLSVIYATDKKVVIGGQYWDLIIWAWAAWEYYLVTEDNEFLTIAFEAIKNTLSILENAEFDSKSGLFKGPAVYGDGVAAYPDKYLGEKCNASIWRINGQIGNLNENGYGIEMKALSTNCVYYKAYNVLENMAKLMCIDSSPYSSKAKTLKENINKGFFNKNTNTYDYLYNECDFQESLGIAYLLLFDIADEENINNIFKNIKITENGIACIEPAFKRYSDFGEYGRHSGTVWPFINCFWANAAKKHGNFTLFEKELYSLTEKFNRDYECEEMFHPETGLAYGGLQEFGEKGIKEPIMWDSCKHQSWSASGYISLILYGILGLKVENNCITFNPYLPNGIESIELTGLKILDKSYNIILAKGKHTNHSIIKGADNKTVLLFDGE